ncbi:hypothetical protein LNI90_10805 [Tenacibaculum dicentrarchi]|nr:hypothetical protein [Tenacibaculum dicentrarchi]MCD8421063.1 hypothetical protein [Tenacibaculum dicentrarchi]MCD8436011.1 hypothetical protein [Tenacibaculum dicentrarchi]MCD8438178.1 hypothetical protein [Tenacibaculum dicentrarchi]MCD8452572.1 hypothetical protein [Tenacibaculum dicentrarchi]
MNYIADKLDLRKVEFPKNINNVIDCGGKGYFHLWLERKEIIFALIETEDGTLREIPARNIQFVENYSESKSSVSI